jgi:hypothetical protein
VTNRIIHAYQQAPWRTQLQGVGLFLLVLVCLVLVAGLFLGINGQTATAGLELRSMRDQAENLRQSIASLEVNIAYYTSVSKMQERAYELGYKRVAPSDVIYVIVPGYTGKPTAILAGKPGDSLLPEPMIKPAYTQSLWDWMFQGLSMVSGTTSR